MKIIDSQDDVQVMTREEAKRRVLNKINNTVRENVLYVVKYDGKLISLSGRYYKFGYKTMGNLRTALTNKFGRDLAEALVESDVITVEKVYM